MEKTYFLSSNLKRGSDFFNFEIFDFRFFLKMNLKWGIKMSFLKNTLSLKKINDLFHI